VSQIDVTELLHDPDFVDEMQVINRYPTVDSGGENELTEDPFDTVGAVQPADGKSLERVPESLWVTNMMTFWVEAKIVASKPGEYAAILVFRGQRFAVKHVFDWTAAGPGWCEGLCVAEVAAP
jgi:hypothetical protein